MEGKETRTGWSLEEYEKRINELLINQAIFMSTEEVHSQTVHELKSKLKVKEAMEDEYSLEIASLTSTNGLLAEELKASKKKYKSVQHSLADLQQEINELKMEKVQPLAVAVEKSEPQTVVEVPGVSWDDWQVAQREIQALHTSLEECNNKIQTQKTTIAALQELNANIKNQVDQTLVECQTAKTTYFEIFEILQEHKEQLGLAHEEIALLRSQPTIIGARGNSLFAEVDDNRQVLEKRLEELRSKYMELGQKIRRNAVNPSTFAVERASLQRMLDTVVDYRENQPTAETTVLNKRIRVQDQLIKQLTEEKCAPIKLVVGVGVAEMKFIEGVVEDSKRSQRKTEAKLNQLSREHLITQQELLETQASLAAANGRLVQLLARERLREIERQTDGAKDAAAANAAAIAAASAAADPAADAAADQAADAAADADAAANAAADAAADSAANATRAHDVGKQQLNPLPSGEVQCEAAGWQGDCLEQQGGKEQASQGAHQIRKLHVPAVKRRKIKFPTQTT